MAQKHLRAATRSGRQGAFAALTSVALLGVAAPVAGVVGPHATADKPCVARVLPAPAQGAAAVAALGGRLVSVAARNGVTGPELAAHLRSDSTLWVDQCGDLFFQDELVADVDLSPASQDNASWPSVAAPADALLLHSRPGSERVVFLDFDGHTIAGTGWNSLYGQDTWSAPAFSTDADPTTFTDSERALIIEVWRRVAQDFAPFAVDVTTQDPGEDAITRSGSTDSSFGTRVLVSPDATQSQCGCGGRAYVNVFAKTSSHSYYQPAWVYPQALSNNAKYIAEAASHEAGHTLGLSHDGTTTSSYYGGSGGWGPIMGAPYGQAVTQWSDGSYPAANNTEDDVAKISGNGAPLVGDDVGDSADAARSVPLPGSVSALLNTRTDRDAFAMTTAGGRLVVTADPYLPGPNADLALTLTDAQGVVVASSSPVFDVLSVKATTGASVDVDVPAGTYTVTVEGTGNGVSGSAGESDYGSIGWYTLTVDGVPSTTTDADTTAPTSVANLSGTSSSTGTSVSLTWTAATDDRGVAGYRVSRDGGQPATVTSLSFTDAAVVPGVTYSYAVAAVDAAGNVGPATTATVTTAAPDTTAPSSVANLSGTSSATGTSVSLTWTAATDDRGVAGYRVSRDGGQPATVTSLSFTDAAVAPGTTYSYAVAAVDGAGNVGPAATATVTTTASDNTAPSAVANLKASVSKNRAVKLTWSAATDNVAVTAYLVSRNGAAVGTVSTLSFTQQRVGVGSYTYSVQARDAAGNLSGPATVTVTVK